MAITEHLRTVGSWSGQDVDAEAVQAQLTRLWRTSVDLARKSGAPAAARTNVFTLVAYAGDRAAADRIAGAIGALIEHHPSRTILIQAESGAADGALAADVVTRCRIDRPQVCHEQIVLHTHNAMGEQVSSAVDSLLLRDLPTYLWWPGDTGEQPDLLGRLAALCDGVIVDSGSFTDPRGALPALLRLLAGHTHGALADLHWQRLMSLRDITAQFFDAATTRPFLDGIVAVDIVAGDASPGAHWSAMLYLGWLASRLNWRPPASLPDREPRAINLTANDRTIRASITGDGQRTGGPGTLRAVQLQSSLPGRCATFSIERGGDDQLTTRIAVDTTAPIERTMVAPRPSDASLLSQVLGYFRRDAVYDATLRWLRGPPNENATGAQ